MNAPSAAPSFPKLERVFGNKRRLEIAACLPKPERYGMKQAVEALAAEFGVRVNDVLDFYGLDRSTYWNQIDTIITPDGKRQEDLRDRDKPESRAVGTLPAAEQLAMHGRVEQQLLLDGKDLPIACQEAGLTIRQYYSIDRRLDELRRRAEADAALKVIPGIKANEQIQVTEPAERAIVHDATMLLAIATRKRIDETARRVGITYAELLDWRHTQEIAPLLGGRSGRSLPLPRAELNLSIEDRVRLLKALKFLQTTMRMQREEVAGVLGFKGKDLDAWTKVMELLTKTLKDKTSADGTGETATLTQDEVTALSTEAGITPNQLRPWLKPFGLRDVWAQLELDDPPFDLPSDELIALWEHMWHGTHSPHTEDVLVRYYAVAADIVARRFAFTGERELFRGYALPGVLDAVRKYKLSGGTARFMGCAIAFAEGALKKELEKNSMSSRSVQRIRSRLRKAVREYAIAYGHEPNDEELAQHLGTTVESVQTMKTLLQAGTVMSLSTAQEDGEEDREARIPDRHTPEHPRLHDITDERMEAVGELLEDLTDQDRLFLTGYFATENMTEVAAAHRMPEADAWVHLHLLLRTMRRAAGDYDIFKGALPQEPAYDPYQAHEAEDDDVSLRTLESAGKTAPKLLERAARWLSYALRKVKPEALLEDLEDKESAYSSLHSRDLQVPDDVNFYRFARAVRLVLNSRAEFARASQPDFQDLPLSA
jgi:DNA-directed RNA polymerase specialized sigma subunit